MSTRMKANINIYMCVSRDACLMIIEEEQQFCLDNTVKINTSFFFFFVCVVVTNDG